MPGNKAIFFDAITKGHNAAWDGEWKKAVAHYARALVEFPGDASVRSSYAQALEEAGQFESALLEYQNLARAKPSDPLPLARIAGLYEKLHRPAEAAATLLAVAELYLKAKQDNKAIEAWQKAVALEPDRTEAHQRLAEAYVRSGQPALASAECLALAQIYRRSDNLARARGFAEQALGIDPRNQSARGLLDELARAGSVPVAASPVAEAQQESLARLAQTVLAETSATQPAEEQRKPGARQEIGQAEIDALITRAVGAQAQQRYGEAIAAYQQLMSAGVARPEIKFNLGLLYFESSRYAEAIGLLNEIAADPNYELASHYTLGKCYRAQGNLPQAVNHFLQVVKLIDLSSADPARAKDLTAIYEGLTADYSQGEAAKTAAFSQSLDEFLSGKRWQERVAQVRQYLEVLRTEDNQVTLAEVIQIPKSEMVLDALALSQQYAHLGKFGAATEECYRAIEFAPAYLPAHIRLAQVMRAQQRWVEAKTKYQVLAQLCVVRGDLRRAEAMYRGALSSGDDDGTTRGKLLDLLTQQNRTADALAQYVDWGDLHARAGQPAQAIEKFNAGLRLAAKLGEPSPFKIVLQHRLAETRAKQGDLNGALTAYQEIRRHAPDDERAHFSMIDLEFRLSQSAAALRDLDDLLARYQTRGEPNKVVAILEALAHGYPQDGELVTRLAQSYQSIGALDKAVAALDALGESQINAGQTRAAMETIRRIIALNPPRADDYKKLLEQLSG